MTDVSEIAKQLGKRGGEATKQKHGTEYYRRLAKLSLAKRWKKGTCPVCGFEGYTAQVQVHQNTAHPRLLRVQYWL